MYKSEVIEYKKKTLKSLVLSQIDMLENLQSGGKPIEM